MPSNLVDRWAEENNNIVKKWKEYETHQQPLQDIRKQCYTECLKLQQKVQGVPAQTGHLKLEIAVTYNSLLFSLSCGTPNETKDYITNILIRALEAVHKPRQVPDYDLVLLWHAVLKIFSGTVHEPWIHKLLLIQWAVWLSEQRYEEILHLFLEVNHKKQSTQSGDLLSETRSLTFPIEEDVSLLVALATEDLKELLHVCTFISYGVEKMKDEKYMEALEALQEASTQPSPRALLAHVHMLTGFCYAKLEQPQCALQCYRKTLEVDFNCHRALYLSSLIYRQLGNTNAEIEALNLLHSAVMLHAESDPSTVPLISSDMLLGSKQISFICQIPSPLHILHTLGHRCVLSDSRTSEGAEYYLDLLASLQSDSNQIPADDGLSFPRIPVVYLEAAFALLKAKRVWDALAVCEEVITKTVDLIPERLLITPSVTVSRELVPLTLEADALDEKMECVLWSGAAYFLQGQAHLQLKDTKEALTNFTRAINQLVKVSMKQKVKDPGSDEGAVDHTVMFLEALKGKVLAFRAVCFVERGQLKEALRDFQLSLQATPGCRNTEMWLVEMLWRLDRKQEAAAMWTQILNSTQSSAPVDLPLYLQTWQEDPTSFDLSSLQKKMDEFVQNSFVTT
ncbi:Fanconi anemia group G protein isoform X1 [Hemibagrus wyckioides]|uniref:Fanconi anemia group G protein isoform X1 n=1 Tax=Hemibagrus wyckioides TaxID=337641 RepID=UPI00266D78E9|nr:Fanconi anemia group G protein isoform X1 [Hemibagrus wyckioides]